MPRSLLEDATWGDLEALASFSEDDFDEDQCTIEERDELMNACAKVQAWLKETAAAHQSDRSFQQFVAERPEHIDGCCIM